jgi:hypothetical protein
MTTMKKFFEIAGVDPTKGKAKILVEATLNELGSEGRYNSAQAINAKMVVCGGCDKRINKDTAKSGGQGEYLCPICAK